MRLPVKLQRLRYLPWLVLLAALAITWQLWKNAQREPERDLQKNFNYRVLEIVNRLDERILSYEQVLKSVQALFMSTGKVGTAEFRTYVSELHLEHNFPGMHGVTLALINPSAQRAKYASLTYIEQYPGRNQLAFGYDVFARPELRAVMESTVTSGNAAVSGKLKMAPDKDGRPQAGFLMYVPIYRKGGDDHTLAGRRANVLGWVIASFRMSDLMFGLLGDSASDLDVEIYDGEQMTDQTLLYDPDYSHTVGYARNAWMKSIVRVEVVGRSWTMSVSSLPDFEARLDQAKAQLIAETGTGISILLALLTWLLVRGRARALQAAREISASEEALRKSHDELEMRVTERTHDLLATTIKLEQEIATRRQLERKILEISEEEQARIGRELHDDLGQLLTGAAYLAGALSSRLAESDSAASKQAGEIKKVTQDAIKRTRYISHGLVPFNLSSQGLRQGLEQLAKDVSTLSGIPCELRCSGAGDVSDFLVATHLYRIAQEALNNAVKHSGASQLTIELAIAPDEIRLIVADNGSGLGSEAREDGLGLLNMNYRAQIVGASLSVDSQPSQGTRVTLRLPLAQ